VRAAGDWSECQSLILEQLADLRLLDPQGRLHLPSFRKLRPALQRAALGKFLNDSGISGIDRRLLEEALAMLEPSGKSAISLPGGQQLRRREGRIWVE
jgi:hypothetical protein